MDEITRVPEEQQREPSDGDSNLPEVVFRPLDWSRRSEIMDCATLYWFFCDKVNQEDVSELKTFEVDGEIVQIPEAEARLYAYKASGCEIQVAYVGPRLSAFLIYSVVFDKIVVCRCLYCEPWTKGLKLAKGFINSLQPIPREIIFQTRKSVPPERMLGITAAHRRVISEDEHFYTHMMRWS